MGLCKQGTELPEYISQLMLTHFQGCFVPFSDYNLSVTQFNPLHIQIILFTAFAFANHVLTLATETFHQTPIQV